MMVLQREQKAYNSWPAEVYTKGHRNPQGMAINSKTNEIWVNEHGPKGGDEINVLKPGKNYGWPIVTYGEEYWGGKIGQGITSLEGFEDPIWYWVPSIAPSGMIFYDKNMFPEFKGHLLVSSLKFKSLYLVKLENELPQKELVLFKKRFGRIRDIEQLNDGSILIISDEKKGGCTEYIDKSYGFFFVIISLNSSICCLKESISSTLLLSFDTLELDGSSDVFSLKRGLLSQGCIIFSIISA